MAIDETNLTKGQVRKLNALRKSVGNELGEDVFRRWLTQQSGGPTGAAAKSRKNLPPTRLRRSSVEMETITSLSVNNLFGRFNHELHFPEESNISIITAPNGFGKTVLLRIIHSLFDERLTFFRKIKFDEIQVLLQSGKSISITQEENDNEEKEQLRTVVFRGHGFGPATRKYELTRARSVRDLRMFERHLPVERIGPDLWLDLPSERKVSTDYIIRSYKHHLPRRFVDSRKVPDWLIKARRSVNAHLVETQRLLYLDHAEERNRRMVRKARSSSVVEKDAEDLSSRIRQLLQRYADESQKLDQTFPERILKYDAKQVSDEASIRAALQELTGKRDDLVSVGLLGSTISEPIRPSQILEQENIRRILEIYIEDTKKKLDIFDETYEKIRIFKELLDERFTFKRVEIDSTHGIRVIDNDDNSTIPLSDLSSGEQHELVLIYELLFKVSEGAVILIDEPELSLHVSWQKKFIEDLQKIQSLKPLKVIIATHSPQIIHDKWELVQQLGA